MSENSYNNNDDIPINVELLQQLLDTLSTIVISNFPVLQKLTAEFIDLVFCPKAMAKQLALAIAIDAGMVTLSQVSRIGQSIISNFSSRSRLIQQLQEEQKNSMSQDSWMELAERIDNIQGDDAWRSDPNCPLYERDRISARIDEFVHLMRRRDIFALMFELRGGIGRNKFGLLHEGLFSKAMAGSKVLVETYHNVVCATLDFVCDTPDILRCQGSPPIPLDARLAFFNEMRHSYGRTALLLSGGAALGFYHAGVVKALMLNNLMPRVVGGSSAGSIVCAMIATRTDDEVLNDMLHSKGTNAPGHSGRLRLNFFRPLVDYNKIQEDEEKEIKRKNALSAVYHNTAGAFHDAKRTWQVFVPIGLRQITSTIYDVVTGNRRPRDVFMNDTNHFRECVRDNIGNFTFQEAFDRTGRILNITVTPNNSYDPPRLLNYLTAPHVLVWSAAVASASLPGVFEANRLMVRDVDGTERYESTDSTGGAIKFNDGSLEQDLPMQQLSEMFNVNHFIISQANAHAVMFASYNQSKSIWTNPIIGSIDAVLMFLKHQLKSWFQNFIEFISIRRLSPMFATQRNVGAQIFTQEYEGRNSDISLNPWQSHRNILSAFLHCVYNPSDQEFYEWIQAAERETWKYIPAIKSHIAEEITLDLCVQRLRKRMIEKHSTRSNDKRGLMDERVPSFFKSPSLLQFSGMNISDRPSIEGFTTSSSVHSKSGGGIAAAASNNDVNPETFNNNLTEADPNPGYNNYLQEAHQSYQQHQPQLLVLPTGGTVHSGWGGLGLKGNRSSGSLRSTGDLEHSPSGFFIDDEEQQQQKQVAGEHTIATAAAASSFAGESASTTDTANTTATADGNYVKTACMAQFYYRHSHGAIGEANGMQNDNNSNFTENQSQSFESLSQQQQR